jgi:hypothetical protein
MSQSKLPALQKMTLPVFADAYEGLADVHGMLSFDGAQLTLSYRTQDALFGALKSATAELEIDLSCVEQARFGLGWWWLMPFIELKPNDFSVLTKFSAAKRDRWRLRVAFADRHQAKRLVEQISFARAKHLHHAIETSLPSSSVVEPKTLEPTAVPQAPPKRNLESE